MPPIFTGGSSSTSVTTALGGMPAADADVVINASVWYQSDLNIATNQINSCIIMGSAKVGGAGESLVVDLSGATDFMVMRSSEPCYVAGGGTGGEIQKLIVESAPNGLWVTGGTVPLAEVLSGVLKITSGCDAQAISAAGGLVNVDTHGSHTLDTLVLAGGAQCETKRSITTSATVLSGAHLRTTNRALLIEAINLHGRWTVNNGDADNVVFYPGAEIDLSTLEANLEIGGDSLIIWPGVRIVGNPPPGITVTWGTPVFVAGGSQGPWGDPA